MFARLAELLRLTCNCLGYWIYYLWGNLAGKQMRWSWPQRGSVDERGGRGAPTGGRHPPEMRTDTGVQGLICVTGEFAYKWKMTEFFCSPQLSMSFASNRLYLTPPHPPPPLRVVWRIFITCEAGAPCLLLISTSGQWLNLLNFISGAMHFFFLPLPVCCLCSSF